MCRTYEKDYVIQKPLLCILFIYFYSTIGLVPITLTRAIRFRHVSPIIVLVYFITTVPDIVSPIIILFYYNSNFHDEVGYWLII